MAGKMRKRTPTKPRTDTEMSPKLKGFHAPQRDSSKRQRRKVRLNNYNKEALKDD